MSKRRILSLWFPRLGAERVLRAEGDFMARPFATVAEVGNARLLASLSSEAAAEGLRPGQPLRDALAVCPALVTRPAAPEAEAAFLAALRRWAGKFSPWVADDPPEGLVIDLTGCAHLFGGEAALMAQVEEDCAALGLTVRAGIADSVGAAWALSHYAGGAAAPSRSGDAIDQEARATRSRAAKRRHWERGGTAPLSPAGSDPVAESARRIAPPGQTRTALSPLPVAALRLDGRALEELGRLGLRRVGDLVGLPRATLARRFGQPLVRRLDQALGIEPEPVSPARPDNHFAVRMSFPEPIGLEADVLAALDRLLPALEERLRAKGRGARRVRMQASRVDQSTQTVEIGLARPSPEAARIRPLLAMKIAEIDAGYGIDRLRIEVTLSEPMQVRQMRGHLDAAAAAMSRAEAGNALDDLIGRLGARIGLEAITRVHPADSHIPEKAWIRLTAAWSEPHPGPWPRHDGPPRPLMMWRPEPVTAEDAPDLPERFRWRGRMHATLAAEGPERIMPEWWLDDPEWRSGPRDYWRVTTERGERLWLFYAHGGAKSSGWFCQGAFA